MTSRYSPDWWDEHPEDFVKDLAKRLGKDPGTKCFELWAAIEDMIRYGGCYSNLTHIADNYKTAAFRLFEAAIKDAVENIPKGETAWDIENRWGMPDGTFDSLEELLFPKGDDDG